MIDLEHVTKIYTCQGDFRDRLMRTDRLGRRERDRGAVALDCLDLHVERGEILFVTGESGSGKSTLMKLLAMEIDVTEGRILVDGKDLSKMKKKEIPAYRRNLGIIFQDTKLLEDRTVIENLVFVREVLCGRRRDACQRAMSMLSLLGITRLCGRYPHQLSGGEKQKVLLARALMNDPSILLADEPTGNLDDVSSAEVMDLFGRVYKKGMTVLVATHDLAQVKRVARQLCKVNIVHFNKKS